jgi:hypothetical protein
MQPEKNNKIGLGSDTYIAGNGTEFGGPPLPEHGSGPSVPSSPSPFTNTTTVHVVAE